MGNTQGERKFVRQQEKYSLAEKKELGVLNKNVTPYLLQPQFILLYFPTLHLIRPPPPLFIRDQRVISCTKDELLGFIFNNYSSFVNLLLHMILSGDSVYICKIKKNKVPYHTIADKLLVEWLPKENYGSYRDRESK